MLGFGFNKTKVLASAERYVQQGKLQNAISEYEKVTKEDPKDITVLNTIGDLYARLGQVDSAVNYFKKVGDHYATEGFTVKAIAMYKKLTKLNPTSIDSVQKLADLYTQQGLYNDARQQFMIVADNYIRSNNHDDAARVFQKMLELDPENASLQSKLAELYIKLGKKDDAKNIFLRAAESLYQRGLKEPAADALNRVISLDPGNVRALQMRAQLALDRGDAAQAAAAFEKIPDLDSRPEALTSLLQAYVQLGKVEEVAPCAKKLLNVHHDISGMKIYAETLLGAGKVNEAIGIYQEYGDQLIAANGPGVVQALDTYISKVKDDPKALEDLNTLFQKAGDTSHIAEIMELLAHACVQKGDLNRARDLYKELAAIEPENPLHNQNYKQIQARLGEESTVRELSHEEGSQALMVEELETQEVLIEQHYPDIVASAIQAALTESDLFESYNVPNKALPPLESVLPQAPQDVRLNQRLAALYARMGRNAEAAQRCAVLQKVFSASGLHEEAIKYGEMASKYAQAGGTAVPVVESFTPSQISPSVPEVQPSFSITPEDSVGKVEEFYFQATRTEQEAPAHIDLTPTASESEPAAHAHEVDLSDEWESMMVVEEPAPAAQREAIAPAPEPVAAPEPVVEPEPVSAAPVEEVVPEPSPVEEVQPDTRVQDTVEEVRFYIEQSMWSEAASAVDNLTALDPEHPEVGTFQRQILAAMVAETPAPEPVLEEASAAIEPPVFQPAASFESEPISEEPTVAEFTFESTPAAMAAYEAPTVEPLAPEGPELFVEATATTDLEELLSEEPKAPTYHQVEEPLAQPEPVSSASHDVIGDFVSDLEASLGDDFVLGGPKKPIPMPPPAPPAAMPAAAAYSPEPVVANGPVMPPPTPAIATQPMVAASAGPAVATAPAGSGPFTDDGGTAMLHDLFEEFKEDMEEGSGQTEDPDTHYNLGMAFKEMGLLDEAIGELQKVCQSIDRGQPFSQSMQAFTWLAHCFVEKGVPEASFKWYQKALNMAEDEDTRTAIHYELACAYEVANMKPEALRHFMEVYSANIDYRDVAERIKQLKS
jgi:tetratricopeptide (TPR) repeat protein